MRTEMERKPTARKKVKLKNLFEGEEAKAYQTERRNMERHLSPEPPSTRSEYERSGFNFMKRTRGNLS